MIYALIIAASTLAPAAANETACPLVLPRTAVEVKAPAGWTGHAPSIMRLTGYGMMAGPPESMTYLVPSGSKKLKERSVSTWSFARGEERWLYCTYDDSSTIQISKRLPDSTEQCALSHKRDRFGSMEEMVAECR